ncbi:MAG: HU family DNA-binding protein [Deltaproteobacteria bacterium]|nr:HU family DNA-binding protein [Deltaproteobacteria bacterium]
MKTMDEWKKALSHKLDCTRAGAEETLRAIKDVIEEALLADDEVIFSGLFHMTIVYKEEHQGRNPKTGEVITIPAHKVVKCKAAKGLLKGKL